MQDMNCCPGPRKVLITKEWQSAGVMTSILQHGIRDEESACHQGARYLNTSTESIIGHKLGT